MRLSGWCSPCVPRAHATCQDRIARGLLDGCECEANGGHESAQNPSAVRVFGASVCDNGATTKTAPGGALTPESQGLADCQGVDY